MRNGELGFWWQSLGGRPAPRAPLDGPAEVDVAIVGAGFTGLWSAYYLKRAEPALQIALLEREFAGYGASARNAGWVSGFFSGSARAYARGGRGRGLAALQRAMFETVDEVAGVLAAEGIEADFIKAGQLTLATGDAQAQRLREWVAEGREQGLGEQDLELLDSERLSERVRVAGARCAAFTPHVARVHPAKLVRGLAGAVERLGVRIHESTPVLRLRPHEAVTPLGTVRARWVVRATEGYTSALPGLERALVPLNSSMIITQPLSPQAWAQIGWSRSELLSDRAHVYVYLQRSADGRIAIGGRGAPYRFRSHTDRSGETASATVQHLRRRLAELFPAAAATEIDHAWSGVLGVARDWCVGIQADPRTGLAAAGGYAGQGVAAANLAGRTLCELILDRPGELRALPWVGHRSRRWEPEPLRWAAIHSIYALYRHADRREARSGRPSRLARVLDAASGRS